MILQFSKETEKTKFTKLLDKFTKNPSLFVFYGEYINDNNEDFYVMNLIPIKERDIQ